MRQSQHMAVGSFPTIEKGLCYVQPLVCAKLGPSAIYCTGIYTVNVCIQYHMTLLSPIASEVDTPLSRACM